MRTVYINTSNVEDIFNQLEQNLGGTLKVRPQEYNLVLDNDVVSGVITGVCFKSRICFMEYDVTFKENTLITSHAPINYY